MAMAARRRGGIGFRGMMPAWMQRLGRRRTVAAGCALVVAAGAVALAQSGDPADRNTPEWAARNAGILDRQTRRLIEHGSAEPIVIGIRTLRRLVGEQSEPADQHISFRTPAAAIGMVDLAGGPDTLQRLRWTVFSRTLDPVRPERNADLVACPQGDLRCLGPETENSRIAARRADGEYVLDITVTNVVRSAADRQRVLWGLSGMGGRHLAGVSGRCAFRYDDALGMLATDEPADPAAARACYLSGFVGQTSADGRVFRPANFLQLESDGTARFVVKCMAYVPASAGLGSRPCSLQGYIGVWPLLMTVPSDRANEWNETFLRVQDHLSRHVVSRSD
jgi:hypothetical protein